MATRQRAGDLGAADARRFRTAVGRELRDARLGAGLSLDTAGRRAGISRSQMGRIERAEVPGLSVEQLCRAGRAVGLDPYITFYPSAIRARDAAQLAALDRLERLLGPPLRMRREVGLGVAGDQRAWDARVDDGARAASIDVEARLHDVQAVARRVGLKQRDDPEAGVIILVVSRTLHNRRFLAAHREALRESFPMDGAAIARELRRGRVPRLGGIILV
jgi:transcriptional regulator with XRE-family HTH domain